MPMIAGVLWRVALIVGSTFAMAAPSLAAQDPVIVGATPNNDRGDPFRTAAIRLNRNDAELYAAISNIQSVLSSLTAANPVTSVAGRRGAVTISSTDLSDATALGRSILNSTAGAQVLSAIGAAPISSPTFTGTTTIPQLAITGSGSTGDVSKMTVTPSTNAVSGSLARMLGSLSPAGTATVPINWAGANPNSAIAYDLTAASDSAQEAGAIIRMTSSKGASSGTGALSAFKIPLGTEMTMLPGSGNAYAFNAVISSKPGVGNFQVSGVEVNVNIENKEYPPTIGEPFATSLLLQGINPYRQTAIAFINNAGYALGATPAGKYMTYEGLWFYGPYTISDHTIRDDTNSAVSYAITGTHSSAAISDASTTPAALNLSGSYSVAAIFAANSTTPVALATKDGQKVCLKGTDACLYHSGTSLRLSVANTDVAQISDAGAGTFTSLTSTGLTKLGVYTYAQLPACTTANQYTYATVTDAVSTTFGQIIDQGGSNNQVLAYCNGAGWVQR